jgi:hypothetical protein
MPATSSLAPRSAVRYRPTETPGSKEIAVPRASRTATLAYKDMPQQKKKRLHLSIRWLPIGFGMAIMLAVVVLGQLVSGWITIALDDLHYGRPRTFQMDAFVGHESGTMPSHFLALNLHGRIEIIELPGGDPAHARMYVGPQIYGLGAEFVPVTLRFVDPDHTGHPDMLVFFQNSQVVFHNRQNSFQAATP